MTPTIDKLTKMGKELVALREASQSHYNTPFSEGVAAGIQLAITMIEKEIKAEVKAMQENL